MTALIWTKRQHGFVTMHTARLDAYALRVRDNKETVSWVVDVAELEAASDHATDVNAAKQAAETWLRDYLSGLQKQLHDPDIC